MFEANLLPTISNHIRNFGKNLSPVFELASGFGIADIVFYSLNPQIVNKRMERQVGPIESYDLIRILTELNQIHAPMSLTILKRAFPSINKNEDKLMTFLVENQFLIPNRSKTEFTIGRHYKVGLKEVVAIEAKLSNWQRGLYQAYRYRQYATQSYLALYSKYIHRALAHTDEFKQANVGLIEVGDNYINVHITPEKESVKHNVYSALVYERLLRAEHFSPSS